MKRVIIFIFSAISLSINAQQAILSLESNTYNFGKIGEYDGLVTTTFYFSNTGNSPLVITNVRATCGCTIAKYKQEPILPNDKGWITISYNPNGRPGRFSKTITITSNAVNGKTQKLYIKGDVQAGRQGITKHTIAPNNIHLINHDQSPKDDITFQKNKEERASGIDSNIPIAKTNTNNTYVLIIVNETYSFLDKVNYATNDGKIFKEYCIKTLGIPEKQIFLYENASYGLIADGVSKLTYCLDNFENSKAIVYYCGHGIPDEKTGQAYLIPVDGKGTNMTTCYSLKNLYKTLAATKAESITYFMDACFTGANKDGSMLVAARGVAREPVKETLAGKTVVFSASSGDETAMTLEEQGHGLFTYYLLKKLQETEGNVTYGELADYINKNVKKDAFLINEKPQTPVVATSPAVQNTWKNMKLK